MSPKGAKGAPKVSPKSADPGSGVSDHFELGEVYLPLPPPPWGLRRRTLVPIGVKTLYTYIGSTLWPFGTKFCPGGLLALWAPFNYFGELWGTLAPFYL